jgi:hypothetical protein
VSWALQLRRAVNARSPRREERRRKCTLFVIEKGRENVFNATSEGENRGQEGHPGAGIHNEKNKTLISHYQGFSKDPKRSCHLSIHHA